MSDNDKPSTTQVEAYDAPKKRGCLGHLKKFWWAYLIGFIIVVVVVVCLIIFVAIPKIAQQKIDAASLSIEGIVVTNTQSQNFTMAINSTIRTDGSVKAVIAGFVGEMYLEDLLPHTPFAAISFPETTSDALQTVNVSQFIPITNMAAFTTFNTWLLHNTTLRVTVAGNTNIQVHGISKNYPVTFSKTIEMPGLQNFDGSNVTDSTISLEADKNGDNFRGFVTIPNRSLVTFEIGNVTFDSYLLGEYVGVSYLDNVVLVPGGPNNFSMHSNISQAPVLNAVQLKPYCEQSGELPFQLTGKAVVNHGQPLTYYSDALGSGNVTMQIPIGYDLKKDLNITLPCKS